MSLLDRWESWSDSENPAKRFVAGSSIALTLLGIFGIVVAIIVGLVKLGELTFGAYGIPGVAIVGVLFISILCGIAAATNGPKHRGPDDE